MVSAVFRKEAADISRDRRALVISVLIPLILFPLSFFAMNVNLKKTARSLEGGIPAYVNIADSSLAEFIIRDGRVISVASVEPSADLARARIAAVIDDTGAPGSDGIAVRITGDNTSQYSSAACDVIHGIINGYSPGGQAAAGHPGRVTVIRQTLTGEKTGAGIMMLQLLIPMLILVFSATAPMAVSADLFAGERERCTLEHLLSVPVTGAEIITGKYLAALCAGITGVISFMSGIALSYIISPEVFGAAGIEFNVSAASACWGLLFSILVIMTFTAAEFAISVFSRSAREAQILFIPVVITAMACGHTVTMIDVKRISPVLRHVPVVNSGLVLKELVTGIFSWQSMALAALWCMALSIMFLYMCRFMLAREKYIFRA